MVNKGPRSGDTREIQRYDRELAENPPILIWEVVPHTGGLRVAVFIHDPAPGKSGPKPRPPCACNLYGRPRRKAGPHHDEDCGRYGE